MFTVKRYYQPEWGDNWREHFTVDRINGFLGHELKFDNQKLVSNYLRVGYDPDGSWRIYKLRPDFCPAEKVQMEDDITASLVLPREALNDLDPEYDNPSVKLVANCERLLFQRPDDAIHRGVDKQAEADIAGPGNFLSNFEPITIDAARALVEHVVEFDQYSEPMKVLLEGFAERPETDYVVSSAHPRVVNGKRTTNPRYLQRRPDLANPQRTSPGANRRAAGARNSRGRGRFTCRSTRCWRDGGTARRIPRPACRRWRCTARSITRNCRSCSWISSAA